MNRKKLQLLIEGKEEVITRRTFFGTMGWSGLLVSLGVGGGAGLKFMFPNVLFEPESLIKLGRPDVFPEGFTFLDDSRLFVVRQGGSFHVISAVCTHLGCTVKKVGEGFNCPCHGSKFDPAGRVLTGPAPRPLEWFEVRQATDGLLVADTKKIVQPGFSLKASA